MKDSDWAFLRQLYLTPNITRTANELFISQPALTKRLQAIEDEWNIQIVVRNRNGIDFTSEGLYLAKQALQYMDFLENTKSHLDMLRSNHKTNLTIATSLSFLKFRLSSLIALFSEKHPEIRFDLVGGRSSEVLHMVEQGNVQLGILRGRTSELVEKIQIDTEQCFIITGAPLDDIKELASMPYVNYPMNDLSRQLVDNWWNGHFSTPPIIGMKVEHLDQAISMVSQSLGFAVGFLPTQSFSSRSQSLFYTPMTITQGTSVLRPTWLIRKSKSELSPEAEYFKQFIVDYMQRNL